VGIPSVCESTAAKTRELRIVVLRQR
jgi:hypothetical protein